jgi:predicted enzyme related to lactoylglutathione lyase
MGRPVVHFEIGCKNKPAAESFYSRLFDWKMSAAGPASMIETGGSGIPGHLTSLGHEPHHYTMFYVEVDDIPACLDKARELGGRVLVPRVPIPTGAFAWIADPEGNTVGLLERAQGKAG